MRRLLLLFALIAGLLALASNPAVAQTRSNPIVRADLVLGSTSVQPGRTVWVALRQRIRPNWHTYWRNPGDAGQATEIRWTLPAGWRAGPVVWPAPTLTMVGPLANYGYHDEVWLPVALTAPADAAVGSTIRLRAEAAWLVCEEVCVPEQAALALDVPVVADAPPPGPAAAAMAHWLARVPTPPAATRASFAPAPQGRLRLAVERPRLPLEALRGARFFPHMGGVIDHAAPQSVERGPSGFTLTLTPAAASGVSPTTLDGVVVFSGERAVEVAAPAGSPPSGAAGLGPVSAVRGGDAALSLLPAVGLALLGGLLLNLMPCVFPVLAIKAARLVEHAGSPAAARRGALAYAAGVLLTFAALAATLIVLRGAGEAVGWGFQLQSPPVVGALALLMLLAGLNLSGVFTVGSGVQGAAGASAPRSGLFGDLLAGALAVALAAPCVAPFMAGATGWALVQGPAEALGVFLSLGVGLAAPFVLIAFAPGLLARLPRPGPWMIKLQRWLALPMYAAALWLAWVLWRQVETPGMLALGFMALGVVHLAFECGRFQRGESRRRYLLLRAGMTAATLAILLPLIARLDAREAGPPWPGTLAAQAWSPARVAAAQAQGRPVLVNFTADWCVTCQLNERVTLSDRRTAQALRHANAVYLVADWTRRDAAIAQALDGYGRAGVPLYVVHRTDGEIRVLPQILSRRAIEAALEP